MKKSEISKLLSPNISREKIRQLLFDLGYGNFYQELEMDSPLVDIHQDINYSSDHVVQHCHLFYEIIYCVQGNIEYLLDTHMYQIQAGDIIIVPPGIIHCPILPKQLEPPYERYVLWLSNAFAESLHKYDANILDFRAAVVLRTQDTKWDFLRRYFIRGIRESDAQIPGWQVYLGGITAQLIVDIDRAAHEMNPIQMNLNNDLLESILHYVQNNLEKDLSIDKTAQHFHISQSRLTHLFHKEMGISFHRSVVQRRLSEAKNKIALGLSLEQVSMAVGFQEYSSFFRAFKSEYGISPMQYRKNILE